MLQRVTKCNFFNTFQQMPILSGLKVTDLKTKLYSVILTVILL